MHNDTVFTLLAQASIYSGIEVYVPEKKDKIVESFNAVGAKFITAFTDKAAFHYRNEGPFHYLKLVGPNAPKGGGFYLSPKLEESKFIIWMDAFVKGFISQEIAIKLGATISDPYTLIQKINILEELGNLEELNLLFAKTPVVQLKEKVKKVKAATKTKPKPKKKHG